MYKKSGVVVGNNQLLLHLLLARQEIDALLVELGAARPQALQIVELAILLEEQVHDHRADVDGAPLLVIGQATLEHNVVVVLEPLVALVELDEYRADVPIGQTRADDHVVGVVGLGWQTDAAQVDHFLVRQKLEHIFHVECGRRTLVVVVLFVVQHCRVVLVALVRLVVVHFELVKSIKALDRALGYIVAIQ